MKAKRSLLVLVAGCGCLALALQQQPRKYVILDDKKGGFKIYDVESALGSFEPGGDYTFDASGSPMRGHSKEQGLTFSMRSMSGVAARTEGGSFRVKSAKANGSVVAEIASSGAEGSTSRSHIETEALTLTEDASESTITFPGDFTFANRVVTSGTDRFFEFKAPGGTFVTPLLSQTSGSNNPFKSATVRGPVTATIDSKRTVAEGTSRQLIKLKSATMTYDGATRILRFEGGVEADVEYTPAKGDSLAFTSNYEWLTVELDERSAVVSVKSGAGKSTSKGGGL